MNPNPEKVDEKPEEETAFELKSTGSEFRDFHNALRKVKRRGFFFWGKDFTDAEGKLHGRTGTYVREMPKTIKGKTAIKAAKRRDIAAMKAAGHLRGSNEIFIVQ